MLRRIRQHDAGIRIDQCSRIEILEITCNTSGQVTKKPRPNSGKGVVFSTSGSGMIVYKHAKLWILFPPQIIEEKHIPSAEREGLPTKISMFNKKILQNKEEIKMFQGKQKLRMFIGGRWLYQIYKGCDSEWNKRALETNLNPKKEIKSTGKIM